MNLEILQSRNTEAVREYVLKKFKSFNGWTYRDSTAKRKCLEYYIAAAEWNKSVVAGVYFTTFKKSFPTSEASTLQAEMERAARGPMKVEHHQWIEMQEDKLESASQALEQLKIWKEHQDYQEGEGFFLRMKSLIHELDPTLCDKREFLTEWEAKRVATMTGSMERSAREVQAEFEVMAGIQQNAGLTFSCYSGRWGTLDAELQQSFRAGAWGRGEAKAKMERMGFSAEAQLALAIGAEFNVDGKCTWRKGKVGLDLEGNCNLFLGARGQLAASLSVNAMKGLEAAFTAEAFVGFSASASGSATFNYAGETLLGVTGTAEVSFGVGGKIEASIATPIFGATEFSFSASAAVGLGFGVGVETEINFTEIFLAGRSEFSKVIYLPTLARGYRMDLMTQDAKNLHYLNKCIVRMEALVEELSSRIDTISSVPSEKQSLLRSIED